jgi:trimeric autotransporter adhesin
MCRLQHIASLAATAVVLCSLALPAQTTSTAPRIVQPVDDSRLVTLKGNVTALARPQLDQGEADAATPLDSMRLVLSRSPEQEAALEQYMAQQLDKSSPNYHKWLTPQQFGKLYGPADSDIAAIEAWLESHGLRVESVSAGRTDIVFSGHVSQIEETFHTQIHSFNGNGRQFYSNITSPSIPAALAPVVSGIAHLNTIEPRPLHVSGGVGMLDPETRKLVPANGANSTGPKPELTTGTSPNYFLYLVPGDAATIYDSPNQWNATSGLSSGYIGTGVTIGVAGRAVIQAQTVVDYRTRFLNDSTAPLITNVDGVTSTTDTNESYIDTELSGGLAPGATIHYYTAQSLNTAIAQAISDNTVDLFTLGYQECEEEMDTADNAWFNSEWQQAAAQGITVLVSAGDDGAAACDAITTSTGANTPSATNGLQVNGLASTPYNIAVGGTDFSGLSTGFSTYVGTANGTFYNSALSYIPESTWNNSTTTNLTISTNVPLSGLDSSAAPLANILAGSGGASSCSTNDTVYTDTGETLGACTSGYTKPSWQQGAGVPNDGVRDLPDVSLFAGSGKDNAGWLACTDDTYTQDGIVYTTNCTSINGTFVFEGFGGTSTAAPAFAGILAMVEQKVGGRLGVDAAQTLYTLYNSSQGSVVFHDVTTGNNSVPCTTGTPNCNLNSAGYYFLSGYNATTGYDLATGLGSVDIKQLVNNWNGTVLAAPTLTLTPSSTSITTTDTLTVAVTVAGNATFGTPAGTVTLTSGTYSSGPQTLVSGSYTFSVPPGKLAQGGINTTTITVSYSGAAGYAPTSADTSVLVTGVTPTMTVTPSSNSIQSNQPLSVTVIVAGSGSTPTGTVTLSGGGYTVTASTLSGGTCTLTIPAGTLAAGTDVLTVSYSGDSIYAGATGITSVTVNPVTPLTPSMTVTPASTTVDTSQSLNFAVSISGTGGTPTGTVALSGGGYTGSAVTLASGAATITIPANSLSAGSDTLTVSYTGDGTYAPATATTTVTVTQSVYSVSPGTPLSAISPGGTATETIMVNSSTSYSGAINLACALTTGPTNASSDAPACTVNPSSVTLGGSSGTSATATLTITTTKASAQMQKPRIGGWLEAGSGITLALVAFFGIPAKRRKWRAMLGMVALLVAFSAFSACGGGGSSGMGNTPVTPSDPGTAAGAYAFTVTATGNPSVTPAPTATISLTIN